MDLDAALATQPQDTWDAFPLFQLLNDYLCSERKTKENNGWLGGLMYRSRPGGRVV